MAPAAMISVASMYVLSQAAIDSNNSMVGNNKSMGDCAYLGGSPSSCSINTASSGVGNSAPRAEAMPASTSSLP